MSFIQNTRNLGKEVFLLYLFVAMADKLSAGTRGLDKLLEADQLVHHRFPRLMTLLDGRNHNLVNSWRLHHLALRKLAVEEREFIKTDFRGFLSHPFDTLHHLGWRNRQMDMSLPGTLLRHLFLDFIETSLAGCSSNLSTEKGAFSIHEEYLVPTLQSQNAQGMGSFLGRQFHLISRIRHIEISYFFHYLFAFFAFSSRRLISSRI